MFQVTSNRYTIEATKEHYKFSNLNDYLVRVFYTNSFLYFYIDSQGCHLSRLLEVAMFKFLQLGELYLFSILY